MEGCLTETSASARSKLQRGEQRQAEKAKQQARLAELAADLFLNKSWLRRKEDAMIAYADEFAASGKRGLAVEAGCKAARASTTWVKKWVADFVRNDGFFSAVNWGHNVKVPSILADEEVVLKSQRWWLDHAPKSGEPTVTISDFHTFLVGSDDGSEPGLLQKDEMVSDSTLELITEEICRRFAHWLGFDYRKFSKGSFSDQHESEQNQRDRTGRFLPQYFQLWAKSPNKLPSNTDLSVDQADDVSLRKYVVEVLGGDGQLRHIDLGGMPPADGDFVLLGSHDECCFKAGEYASSGWLQKGRDKCMDKTDGPSYHVSAILVEWGNGVICLHPEKPAPPPTPFKEFVEWHQKWEAGVPCDLPESADVSMQPGSGEGKDGWWKGHHFWWQVELSICIFERLFGQRGGGSKYVLALTLDWSQNHAAHSKDALVAEAMNVNPGGVSVHHLRPTRWKRRRLGHWVESRQVVCHDECPGTCLKQWELHKDDPDFQTIGKKGLRLVCQERGIWKKGMVQHEMVAALQECDDFRRQEPWEQAHVTSIMREKGHIALFGTKYHAELASIERKWMFLKRRIRKRLNGKLAKLKQLVHEEYGNYSLQDAQKAGRHCRDTMHAYVTLGKEQASLDSLRAEEKKMKGHRRVFDSCDNILKLKANVVLTEGQMKAAGAAVVKRETANRNEKLDERHEIEKKQLASRISRAKRGAERVATDKQDSKMRKAKMLKVGCVKKQLTLKQMCDQVLNQGKTYTCGL